MQLIWSKGLVSTSRLVVVMKLIKLLSKKLLFLINIITCFVKLFQLKCFIITVVSNFHQSINEDSFALVIKKSLKNEISWLYIRNAQGNLKLVAKTNSFIQDISLKWYWSKICLTQQTKKLIAQVHNYYKLDNSFQHVLFILLLI